MDETGYIPRIIDSEISLKIRSSGALLIQGPKWVGKTTTAMHFSKSAVRIDDPVHKTANLTKAEVNPRSLLEGDCPRLIDEWQLTPTLWDSVRHEVDERRKMGQFILTGSATPADRSKISHSGTGRFTWALMRPMTLFESGESSGHVGLGSLFEDGCHVDGRSKTSGLDGIAFATCRGGWPLSVQIEKDAALAQTKGYVNSIINAELLETEKGRINPYKAKMLMRSYARHQGSQATLKTVCEDIFSSEETTNKYINALKRMFVIEDLPSWNPNLRSKTAIRTTPTRYFVDPSIATASLGIGPAGLLSDINTFGLIFETLCIRDLRVYAESINGNVYHYKDANNLECDAVIILEDGRYGLVEIKLGGDTQKDRAAKTLNALAEKIDTDKMDEPSFRTIVTATDEYAYTRDDGVCIVPIGCLKN